MKLIDSNRFFLPGTQDKYLHLATVHNNCREYMCFANIETKKLYIEEITGGIGPLFINDDILAFELTKFIEDKGLIDMSKPLLTDTNWLKNGKNK